MSAPWYEDPTTLKRVRRALKMKEDGIGVPAIAQQLGVSDMTIFTDFRRFKETAEKEMAPPSAAVNEAVEVLYKNAVELPFKQLKAALTSKTTWGVRLAYVSLMASGINAIERLLMEAERKQATAIKGRLGKVAREVHGQTPAAAYVSDLQTLLGRRGGQR